MADLATRRRHGPGHPMMEAAWPARRRWVDAGVILALLLLTFLTREWRLGVPPNRYFDETYYVKSGYEYIEGRADTNTVHPPLGKIFVAAGVLLYQAVAEPLSRLGLIDMVSDSAGWRVGSLLFALAMLPLTYALGLRMFRSRFVAATAAYLLAIDPLHIVQSRIAMLDMFVAFFILAGAYASWRFIEADRSRLGWAVLSAVLFGVGTACKWNSLFAAGGAGLAMLLLSRRLSWRWVVGLPVLLAVATVGMYRVAHIPFFAGGGTYEQLRQHHKTMYDFRKGPQFTHKYMSHWYQWPTLIRPVWYHYEEYKDGHGSVFPQRNDTFWTRLIWRGRPADTYVAGIIAIGSPFVWATFLIFFVLTLGQSLFVPLWLAVRGHARPPPGEEWTTARQRVRGGLDEWRFGPERPWVFLILLYTPQVVLWSVNQGFFFYMLGCVPFMAIMVAAVLNEWVDLAVGRTCIALYLVIATLCAAAYFPLLTAYPIPKPIYDLLILSRNWI